MEEYSNIVNRWDKLLSFGKNREIVRSNIKSDPKANIIMSDSITFQETVSKSKNVYSASIYDIKKSLGIKASRNIHKLLPNSLFP